MGSRWNIEGKTVLITGGNSGIGEAAARELAQRGARVTFTARNPERGKAALARIQATQPKGDVNWSVLDLARFSSIRDFAETFRSQHETLDVLINNAGLILQKRTKTEQGFEATFGINHLGHFLLTRLLLDSLRVSAPSRIINVSSDAYRRAFTGLDFEDLQSEKSYNSMLVYGRSKLANIYFTRELAQRLAGQDITVNAVHPGVVRTGFARDGDTQGAFSLLFRAAAPFMLSPEQGARTLVYLATAPDAGKTTGAYFVKRKATALSKIARDDAAARRLWRISEELIEKASADAAA